MASHFHSNVATLAAQADPAKMASRSLQPAGGEAPSSLFIEFSASSAHITSFPSRFAHLQNEESTILFHMRSNMHKIVTKL